MAKYHITKKRNPGICKARRGKCPLGGNEVHFKDKESTQKYLDLTNEISTLEKKLNRGEEVLTPKKSKHLEV